MGKNACTKKNLWDLFFELVVHLCIGFPSVLYLGCVLGYSESLAALPGALEFGSKVL